MINDALYRRQQIFLTFQASALLLEEAVACKDSSKRKMLFSSLISLDVRLWKSTVLKIAEDVATSQTSNSLFGSVNKQSAFIFKLIINIFGRIVFAHYTHEYLEITSNERGWCRSECFVDSIEDEEE